jgi:hypothetical protein
MGWATQHIADLLVSKTIKFRPHGNSMTGKIESGNLCTVEPLKDTVLQVGDIVLCKVGGNQYLHLISAIKDSKYQISNNKGFINGWVERDKIYGILTMVEE